MADTETVYLQSPTALVTQTRAVLNGVTYSMANVTSVRTHHVPPNGTWPLLTLLVGIGILVIGGIIRGSSEGWLFGIVLIAIGGLFLWRVEDKHYLVLGSAGGET